MTEYNKQAQDFLKKFNLKFSATYLSHESNPLWNEDHYRPKYRIRISRIQTTRKPRSLTFIFWDSIAHDQEGKRPTAYDALSCLSSDQYCPDNFEAFCSEYGYSDDSIKAMKLFKACDKFAKRIRRFFTNQELEELSEIQ